MKITPIITRVSILLILIIVLGSLHACKTKTVVVPEEVVVEENPKIIFLTYHISETPSGNRTMQFISQKIVDGKLKKHSTQSIENASDGDLICLQFDEHSNIVNRSLIKNPLKKTVESLNENKSFETNILDLNSTKFSTRISLKNNTKTITISNFVNSKNLISTKIPLE